MRDDGLPSSIYTFEKLFQVIVCGLVILCPNASLEFHCPSLVFVEMVLQSDEITRVWSFLDDLQDKIVIAKQAKTRISDKRRFPISRIGTFGNRAQQRNGHMFSNVDFSGSFF